VDVELAYHKQNLDTTNQALSGEIGRHANTRAAKAAAEHDNTRLTEKDKLALDLQDEQVAHKNVSTPPFLFPNPTPK
jgi:hypothetical protein